MSHKYSATTKFLSGFRWNLFGSISYESIKALHCFLLLRSLEPNLYGFLGSLFATVYLATYIADFGATNSIPPFTSLFTKSQSNLKRFFFTYSMLPHLPIIFSAATLFTLLWSKRMAIVDQPPYLFIVPCLIIFETMRAFLRQFLHTTFQSRITVITELTLMIGYFLAIWVPHWFFGYKLTLNLIFLPHLFDSVIAVIILSSLVRDMPVSMTMSKAGHEKPCLNMGGPSSKAKYSLPTDSDSIVTGKQIGRAHV